MSRAGGLPVPPQQQRSFLDNSERRYHCVRATTAAVCQARQQLRSGGRPAAAAAEMPSKAEQQEHSSSSGDYETASSSEDSGSSDASLFGALKTRLRWTPASQQLHLDVRQSLQNRRSMEVRCKGRLNTNTGAFEWMAQLQKHMHQNTPSVARLIAAERGMVLKGEQPIDPDRFLPGGLQCLLWKDWIVSPGLRLTSDAPAAPAAAPGGGDAGGRSSAAGASGVKYSVTLRKQPQVLLRRGAWDSWVAGKLDLQLDPAAQALGVRGAARLKVFRFSVTSKQDLQLVAGADYEQAAGGGRGRGTLTPYLKVGDNSWTMRLSRGVLSYNFEM